MVLLIFSVILFLLAFPLGEASRITLYLTTSFTFLDLLVVVGSAIWLGKQIILQKTPKSLQAKSFLAVLTIFLISLLFNASHLSMQQFVTAGLYIVRFLCFGLLFFMYRELPIKTKQVVLRILFFGGLLLLVGGYLQYFFYPALRNLFYSGWDEHFYRMFGSFFDPNFFGLFLACFLLYDLWFLRTLANKRSVLFYSLVGMMTFIAIILTYSRTSFIALVVGLVVLFWDILLRKRFWLFLIVGIAVAVLVLFFTGKRSEGTNLWRSVSADARLGSARNALIIFTDSPIIGVGFNAYRYSQYQHHFMPGNSIQEDHGASGADTSLLLVLATSGIIGFTAFCFFLWSYVQALVKTKNRIGLATLVTLFVGSFFVNGLFYPLLLVWLWVILGVTESTSQ